MSVKLITALFSRRVTHAEVSMSNLNKIYRQLYTSYIQQAGLFLLQRWVIFVPLLLLSLSGFAHKQHHDLPIQTRIVSAHSPVNIPMVSECCDNEYENDNEQEFMFMSVSHVQAFRTASASSHQDAFASLSLHPIAQRVPLYILFHSWKDYL